MEGVSMSLLPIRSQRQKKCSHETKEDWKRNGWTRIFKKHEFFNINKWDQWKLFLFVYAFSFVSFEVRIYVQYFFFK